MKFSKYTIDFWTNLFYSNLPSDICFSRDKESNTYKFFESLCTQWKEINEKISDFINNRSPRITNIFLEEWESVVGIPDSCFLVAETTEQRRKNIIFKLRAINITSSQDFIELASILGFTITITSGSAQGSFFPFTFPHIFEIPINSSSRWVVNGSDDPLLQCVFNKLKPAQTIIEFLP